MANQHPKDECRETQCRNLHRPSRQAWGEVRDWLGRAGFDLGRLQVEPDALAP